MQVTVSHMQALNSNCTHGIIYVVYYSICICQWLKNLTISSFMFAASVFEVQALGRSDSPVLYDRTTTWAVHMLNVFLKTERYTNLSDL